MLVYPRGDSLQKCLVRTMYVTCCKPKDGKLRELVLLLQEHKHSTYCKKGKTCHFNFPQPPSPTTLIAKPDTDTDKLKEAQKL